MGSVGNKVKGYRMKKRMTQAMLAEGISSRSYISQVEKDVVQPSIKLIRQLCARLNCELNDLLEVEKDPLTKIDIKTTLKELETTLLTNEKNKNAQDDLAILEEGLVYLTQEDKALLYFCKGVYQRKYVKDLQEAIKQFEISYEYYTKINHYPEKIRCSNELTDLLVDQNEITKAFEYLETSFQEMIIHKTEGLQFSKLLATMGMAHAKTGENRSAIRFLKTSLEENNNFDGSLRYGDIHMGLGICYKREGQFDLALNNYEKALHFFESVSDLLNAASTLNNIGIVHRHMENTGQSIQYLTYAYNAYCELGDQMGQLNSTYELAVAYYLEKNYEQVLILHKRFQEGQTTLLNPFVIVKFTMLVGDVQLDLGNEEDALDSYKKAYSRANTNVDQQKSIHFHVITILINFSFGEKIKEWNDFVENNNPQYRLSF